MLEKRLTLLRTHFKELNFNKLSRVFPQIEANIDKLGEIQGHRYQDKKLAAISLVHRSSLVYWPTDKSGIFSNERLEFLGDAFLSFFVASEAMIEHRSLQEGDLSRLRAALVGTENLALKSRDLGIGECLLVGKAEMNSNPQRRDNVLADAFEAVTAALLLDAGEEKARAWLLKIFSEDLLAGKDTLLKFDAKSKLQQWTQGIIGVPPVYKAIGTEGTPQETFFIVAAFIGETEIGRASAASKREASKKVADKIIEKIESGELTKEMIVSFFGKEK
ncbi:ribonuclease III family protein [Fluviispira sanaruensis]|uniref:Ribonuclease 3 n=1 Tax=Fluviispira sanaruensis TaxID=2493639 RepID=A0A4P2VG42_FLUSA|nr:ribonuclease III family protein [Fluviispira sanaruensis]BBH51676.1 ribonuclease III [Fluviispira sanaruensis]